MKTRILGILALGLALPMVAAAAVQPRTAGPQALTAAERARCTARHGQVMIAGLSGREMCALPYRDGGKSCTDGSQCAGNCIAEGDGMPQLNSRVRGRCQRLAYPFGCATTITRGRANATLCTD